MAELFRFAAFISYSSKDSAFARRLHGALERYRIPDRLGSFELVSGGKRNRVYPVFRDREELPAGILGAQIESALRASAALIVVCSPSAAQSPWVQEEIEYFISLGRRDRIFAIVASTVSGTSVPIGGILPTPLLRSNVGRLVTSVDALAADARVGQDGFEIAKLKLVAGLVGVGVGDLRNRDRAARMGRVATSFGLGAMLGLVGIFGVASLSEIQSRNLLASWAVYDLTERSAASAVRFALAGASHRGDMLAFPVDRAELLLEQSAGARVISTGISTRGGIRNFHQSEAGDLLYIEDSSDNATLVRLTDGGGRCELGEQFAHLIPRQGSYVVTLGKNGHASVIRFERRCTRLDLGLAQELRLYSGGRYLAWRDPDELGRIMEVETGRIVARQRMGALQDVAINADGSVRSDMRTGENGAEYDLREPVVVTSSARRSHVIAGSTRVYDDGSRAVAHQTDGGRVLLDTNLGRVSRFALSADGRALYAVDPDQNLTQFEFSVPLRRALIDLRGDSLVRVVCATSGNQLSPFPSYLREDIETSRGRSPSRTEEQYRLLSRALIGRPRNPCDWRGFLAILPNRATGDRWFEGPRQWLRLISVKYFGGRDWSCAETTSGASPAIRQARARMCAPGEN